MNQHTFVTAVQKFYKENDIQPGDPNEGVWEEAHFPAPKGEGDDVILLLHEHHQVQGLLQSKEFERLCFFPPDVRQFLNNNWCENWFELWDICERHTLAQNRKNGLKNLVELNEEGKSANLSNAGKQTHKKRNSEGKSCHALEHCKKLHEKKDENGKSVVARKAGKVSGKKSSKAVEVIDLKTGDVFWFPNSYEAAEKLNLLAAGVGKVCRGERDQHRGHKARFLETFENPFY